MNKTVLISLPIEDLQTVIIDCVNACLRNNKQESKTPAPHEPDLITRKEAVKLLSTTPATLWRWEKHGKIKSYGIEGKRYYKRTELLEALTIKKG